MKRLAFILTLLVVSMCLTACEPPEDMNLSSEDFKTKTEVVEENATTITMWCADFEEWQNRLNMNQCRDFNEIKTDGIQLEQVFIQQIKIFENEKAYNYFKALENEMIVAEVIDIKKDEYVIVPIKKSVIIPNITKIL